MKRKEKLVRALIGGALFVWLGVGYDFMNPWLWTAAFLTLVPALGRD